MAKLWALLTNELGQGFRTQFGDEGGESFRYWCEQLKGFTEQEIFKGVERWVYSDDRFINVKIIRSLCKPRPEDFGLPSVEEAFKIAFARDWENAHPALQCVLSERMYDLRRMTDAQSRQAFAKIYREIVERVSSGEEFNRPPSIEHNPSGVVHTRASRGAAAQARMEIRRMIAQG